MNFQTWQGSFAFDLIINPNHPLHESNESELAWTCLGELRSKALSFPQKAFSFLQGQDVVVTRHPCCLLGLSPSWWNPSIATLEVLLQLWVLGIQIAAQLISVLFYEWFMEAWRTLRTQHILCFPNVGVMRGALFLPVGTWKTWWAFLAGLNVSERGAKAPAEQAEVQMCVSFDFHWEWQKKILTWFYSSVSC